MNLLQKIGNILKIGLSIATGVQLATAQTAPQIGNVLTPVTDRLALLGVAVDRAAGIIATLKDKNLTDEEKRQIAAVDAAQIVLTSSLVAGHEIGDAALFTDAVNRLSGAIADIKRSLKADKVKELQPQDVKAA